MSEQPEPLRFLIAGFGSIGRRHFHNLQALDQTEIQFYRSHRSTLPDEELAGFQVHSDLDAALGEGPDAVVVANPTALHLEVALPAARAGCHLLLEKPVSHTLEGVAELQEALQAGGGSALIGFQFRFHPGLQKIARLLEEGAIGRPLSFRAHWGEYLPGWHPWEDYRQGYSARKDLGGGVVLTLSHPFDYLRWLLGDAAELWALTSQESDLGLGVEDSAEVGIRLKSGAIGSVHLNYHQRPPIHTLAIQGTAGELRWDNQDGAARLYRPEVDRWETYPPFDGFERNDLFLAEMSHFLEVITGKAAPVCSLEDGIQALELALAVHRAALEGRLIRL